MEDKPSISEKWFISSTSVHVSFFAEWPKVPVQETSQVPRGVFGEGKE